MIPPRPLIAGKNYHEIYGADQFLLLGPDLKFKTICVSSGWILAIPNCWLVYEKYRKEVAKALLHESFWSSGTPKVIARGSHGSDESPYQRGVGSRPAQPSRFGEVAVDEDRGLHTYHLPKTFKYSLKLLGR